MKDRLRPLTSPRCRMCGRENDAHTHTGDVPRVPHDGDLSICAYCGVWSTFEGGVLREPTPTEFVIINTNKDCMSATLVVAALRKPKGRHS